MKSNSVSRMLLLVFFSAVLLPRAMTAPLRPTITRQQSLYPDPNPVQAFGSSVALDKDTLVIGAPFDGPFLDGSAYVFVNNGTQWTRAQKLERPDSRRIPEHFGGSVALSGNTIVIGSGDKTYVYVRTSESWSLQQILDFSGSTVAIDDDTLVTGDSGATASDATGGLAYHAGMASVWRRIDGTWSLEQTLTAPDPHHNAAFGSSIAIRGGTLVLGASGDSGAAAESGAAYVFHRRANGWGETQTLRPTDPQPAAGFGTALAFEEDVIVIGAPGTEDFSGAGAAYVFRPVHRAWRQSQKLAASDGFERDLFGQSVALSGGRLVVGQRSFVPSEIPVGAAYLFDKQGLRWNERAKLILDPQEPGDFFGAPAAISHNTVVVGDNSQNGVGGAAYLFSLQPPGHQHP